MKVLEAQAAVLSNYEVYHHLVEQRQAYKASKRRGPPNLENVVKELLQYLQSPPGPLSQEPATYTPECVARLVERLRPYDLSKGEVVMILNMRPASAIGLNTVVEEMGERFTPEQQEAMVEIIAETLGHFEPPEPQHGADEADEAMAADDDDDAAV